MPFNSLGLKISQTLDALDSTEPTIHATARTNYTQGYPVLQADIQRDYTRLSARLTCFTHLSLARHISRISHETTPSHLHEKLKATYHTRIVNPLPQFTAIMTQALQDFQTALSPLSSSPNLDETGHTSSTFTQSSYILATDLAPYVRGIVEHDVALDSAYRELADGSGEESLKGSAEEGNRKSKRLRMTKASRSAVLGGERGSVRREKWFDGLDFERVRATRSELVGSAARKAADRVDTMARVDEAESKTEEGVDVEMDVEES